MAVRRSIMLLACVTLFACASADLAAANDFGLGYTRVTGEEAYASVESGSSEAILEGMLVPGWSCEVRGEFELRWFIRKKRSAQVGLWDNLRFTNCTNGYLVNEVGNSDIFYYERAVSGLPLARGIVARFNGFSLLTVGPTGDRCQYINDTSEWNRRTSVTFEELRSFVASGTLVFARELNIGAACPATMTVSFRFTTEIPIHIIGIS